MESLKKCFDLQGKEIVSIVGSGGKTSLMWALAKTYRKEAVLVSTTTKIGFPQRQLNDYFYTNHFEKITPNICGITLAGTAINNQTKLTMPAMTSFQTLFQHFTKVFLEADGSKQRPLKGWSSYEPVILKETTTTIGVLPISVIGQKIDVTTIHRLPLFLELTDAQLQEPITETLLAQLIAHPKGLFKESQGQRILCLNQTHTRREFVQAMNVCLQLPKSCFEKLDKIIACNMELEKGLILWEKSVKTSKKN